MIKTKRKKEKVEFRYENPSSFCLVHCWYESQSFTLYNLCAFSQQHFVQNVFLQKTVKTFLKTRQPNDGEK